MAIKDADDDDDDCDDDLKENLLDLPMTVNRHKFILSYESNGCNVTCSVFLNF